VWGKKIERWRKVASAEANGIPVDLVLSLIKQESGGQVGRIAGADCRPGLIPTNAGNMVTAKRALGLMQVVPNTIKAYNKANPSDIATFEQMIGKSNSDARKQVRVGCWVFRKEIHNLNKYDPLEFPAETAPEADTNQMLFAILCYRMGFGATKKRMNEMKAKHYLLDYKVFRREYKDWGKTTEGKWINRPIHYTDTVWTNYKTHKSTSPVKSDDGTNTAIMGGLMLLAVYLWRKFS